MCLPCEIYSSVNSGNTGVAHTRGACDHIVRGQVFSQAFSIRFFLLNVTFLIEYIHSECGSIYC